MPKLMWHKSLRREYQPHKFLSGAAHPNAITQFKLWFADTLKAKLSEPNAMVLSTVSRTGAPGARLVLLKDFGPRGFIFFTNYKSRKGNELKQNPSAALTFYWAPLHRQVRIEGVVKKVSRQESQTYFSTRPRGAQLSASISPQSEEISREELEQKFKALAIKYHGKKIPCPKHWGGYCLVPKLIEFWEGRPNRLHDRIEYKRVGKGKWRMCRLGP